MFDSEISAACTLSDDGQDVLTLRADYNGYEITIWADTNPTLTVSQDAWLITELPGRLRIAALDGVTPGQKGLWRLGLDQAVYASQITRAALQADAPLRDCLEAAHEALLDTSITPVRYRPQTAGVAADLYEEGHCEVVVAYDCEIWKQHEDQWQQLLEGDMLSPEARRQHNALLLRKHELTLEEFIVEEAALLNSESAWVRSGIGQLPELRLAETKLEQWDELGLRHNLQPVSASTTYTFSAWVKGQTAGEPLKLYVDEEDSSPTFVKADVVPFTTTGNWQHITDSFTTAANTASLNLYLFAYGSPSAPAATFWTDGLQLEQHPVATPYVETDGATASRTTGDINVSSTGMSASHGWAAIRARLNWTNANPPAAGGNSFPGLFEWPGSAGAATDNILIYWNAGRWHVKYIASSVTQVDLSMQADAPALGDEVTVILRWTPTSIGSSFNGSSFSSASVATSITDAMALTYSIGRGDAGQYCDCDILWAAAGAGTLSDADAATINGFADNDPTSQDFPAAAQAQMAWSADNTTTFTGN